MTYRDALALLEMQAKMGDEQAASIAEVAKSLLEDDKKTKKPEPELDLKIRNRLLDVE